jgi:hypothetical protein
MVSSTSFEYLILNKRLSSVLDIPGAEALSAFEESHVPRLVSLSFAARAQASFKEMVEASHLYAGPLFSAIGRFIQDDGSVLQCLAYQRRPVPDHQYDIPSLGSCVDDLCFDFHERLVDGLNPLHQIGSLFRSSRLLICRHG